MTNITAMFIYCQNLYKKLIVGIIISKKGICGKWSEYGKDDKLLCDRDMRLFPAIKTGTHS